MSTRIAIVAESLDRGAKETHTIARVVSGSGHRVLSLPKPWGLPPNVEEQLLSINRDLQHAARVVDRQSDWLVERAAAAREADAPNPGGAPDGEVSLYGYDPSSVIATAGAAISGDVAERIWNGEDGPRTPSVRAASAYLKDDHKGDDFRGDDDQAASDLDTIKQDRQSDFDTLRALDAAHKTVERPSAGDSPSDGEGDGDGPKVTTGETTSGGSLRGKGHGKH